MLRQELFEFLGTAITPLKLIACVFIVLIVRVLLLIFKAFIFKTLKKYSWFDLDRGKQK